MTICFNQPAFIPWGGFFCRLMVSDMMVLLDDTLFAQGFTFVNRNRIKGAGGELWQTIPVGRTHGRRQRIRDLQISNKLYWGEKWLETLRHAYSKSMYLKKLSVELGRIIQQPEARFVSFVEQVLQIQRAALAISAPFILQSDLGVGGRGIELLLNCCRTLGADRVLLPYRADGAVNWRRLQDEGVAVSFLNFRSPVYPQFWGDYVANLSFLDMYLCVGDGSRMLLERAFQVIDE